MRQPQQTYLQSVLSLPQHWFLSSRVKDTVVVEVLGHLKVEDRRVSMYETWMEAQRTLDEFMLRAGAEPGFKIPYIKSPNYRRGLRWCGRCQLAFPAERYPIYGNLLRIEPKWSKR